MMKRFLFLKYKVILLLALPIGCLAQTTVLWSDSLVVASSNLAFTAPRMVLLPDGNPLVTWGTSGTVKQIWCSRFENSSFTTPVPVVQTPAIPALFGFGGYDLAIFDSLVYIVFEQSQKGIWLAKSTDRGNSFQPAVQVKAPESGAYLTLASITTDAVGNPVIAYIEEKNTALYKVCRSLDGGATFTQSTLAHIAAFGFAVCECCTAQMTSAGDSVWIIYRNNNANLRDIWVSRATDGGVNFDVATDVDNTDWQLSACPISGPRMARSGDSLTTIWMSQASGAARIYVSTLHAGTMSAGQQIQLPNNISGSPLAQSFPDIAAHGDTIGVVLMEKARELLFFHSVNGLSGLTSMPRRFAVPNHTLQYPAIQFNNGVFHLLYADPTADKVFYRQGILTQSTSATKPAERHSGIHISPNPVASGGQLQIQTSQPFPEALQIEWYDFTGRRLHNSSGFLTAQTTHWQIPGLATGIYTVVLREHGRIVQQEKIAIE